MVIKIVNGDLLEAEENVLVHQVNAQGKFASGVAGQIRKKYPKVYKEYMDYCKGKDHPHTLMGDVQAVEVGEKKYVANIFSQLNYGYDGQRYTSYDSLYNGLLHIKSAAKKEGLSVALPFGIGCGLGGGSWHVVYAMIEDIFQNYEATIYKLEEK